MPPTHPNLKQRLELYKVDPATMAAARKFWYALQPKFNRITQRFYANLHSNPQTARFLPDERGIEQLRTAQAAHWGDLFTGKIDADFVSRVNRAAEAHMRIRLPNFYYMAAYAFFLNELIASAQHLFPDEDERAEVIRAINKLVMIDADLTMSFYMQRLVRRSQEHAVPEAAPD